LVKIYGRIRGKKAIKSKAVKDDISLLAGAPYTDNNRSSKKYLLFKQS